MLPVCSKASRGLLAAAALVVSLSRCRGETSTDGGLDASTEVSSADGCNPECASGLMCCAGQCVNPMTDPQNCGGCSVVCSGSTALCNGQCSAPTCEQDAAACNASSCCGQQCCDVGQFCCEVNQRQPGVPECYTPPDGGPACPVGCFGGPCFSDRNLKRDIEPVDQESVLEALARLPVSTWSYKSDDPSLRHMGPMAQDFKAAFGLGDSDRVYNPIDAHGVALAAIQALYERVEQQDLRIERLEQSNSELRDRCGDPHAEH